MLCSPMIPFFNFIVHGFCAQWLPQAQQNLRGKLHGLYQEIEFLYSSLYHTVCLHEPKS